MSTNADDATDGERPPVTNPETAQQLAETRAGMDAAAAQDELPDVSPVEAARARQTVASEEQPDVDYEDDAAPQPSVKTVPWNGQEWEFDKIGADPIVTIQRLEERGDDADMIEYLCELFHEKRRSPRVSPGYWGQWDLMPDDDDDDESLFELFVRLVGAEDLDEEEQEAVENLP